MPPSTPAPSGVYENRRLSRRRELSERIALSVDGHEIPGWTLNISVGGVRAIIEESLEPDTDVMVHIGSAPGRPGRIIWVQDEPDGSIVGVRFLDARLAPEPLSEA